MVKKLHKQLGKVDFWNPDVGKWGAEILADYGCGYDKIFKYKVNTHWRGIGLDEVTWLMQNCDDKWGWHFQKGNGQYESKGEWYTKWDCIISFNSKRDAVYYVIQQENKNDA